MSLTERKYAVERERMMYETESCITLYTEEGEKPEYCFGIGKENV